MVHFKALAGNTPIGLPEPVNSEYGTGMSLGNGDTHCIYALGMTFWENSCQYRYLSKPFIVICDGLIYMSLEKSMVD